MSKLGPIDDEALDGPIGKPNAQVTLSRRRLLELDALLGLEIAAWRPAEVAVPSDVMGLVQAREAARKAKDYGAADRLRDEVLGKGFVIEDTREGPKVGPA